MERRLYEASLYGDVDALHALILEDPLILHRTSTTYFDETPLHIASMCGHVHFVTTILSHKVKFCFDQDSQGRSPLHIASVEGYVEVVRELLHACVDVALFEDQEGRMPLHLAAMKGRVDIIQELFRAKPEAARHVLAGGETVLHMCVKYNRLHALMVLVELIGQNDRLIVARDEDGNTILHVAAALKQVETIKFLVSLRQVRKIQEAKNVKGFTAMDMVEHWPKDLRVKEIREFLRENIQIIGHDNSMPQHNIPNQTRYAKYFNPARLLKMMRSMYERYSGEMMRANRENLIIVATLIATIAYQTGINPPGGFWQEFASNADNQILLNQNYDASHLYKNNITKHIPGRPILQDVYPFIFDNLMVANNISLLSSLGIILLLISGFPLRNRFAMWILVLSMSLTVGSTAITYIIGTRGTYIYDYPSESDFWSIFFELSNRQESILLKLFVIIASSLFIFHSLGLIFSHVFWLQGIIKRK